MVRCAIFDTMYSLKKSSLVTIANRTVANRISFLWLKVGVCGALFHVIVQVGNRICEFWFYWFVRVFRWSNTRYGNSFYPPSLNKGFLKIIHIAVRIDGDLFEFDKIM